MSGTAWAESRSRTHATACRARFAHVAPGGTDRDHVATSVLGRAHGEHVADSADATDMSEYRARRVGLFASAKSRWFWRSRRRGRKCFVFGRCSCRLRERGFGNVASRHLWRSRKVETFRRCE
jgi:hypothetical protein